MPAFPSCGDAGEQRMAQAASRIGFESLTISA
jgi:hypothetical protein